MEHLVSNLSGKLRKETLNNKEYLVAPMSLIAPGVLNGSKGPLYYPPDEIAKNVDAWNGMPIVVYHPKDAGQAISARSPAILNSQGIGFVFNANFNGKLIAEGWFDIVATERIDDRVLNALERGNKIELSTGLYTENYPAEDGATYNGRPYDFIAMNYRPDHLAILPDQIGACSIKDGCGVLVNKKSPVEETQIPRKEIPMANPAYVTELITNCDCWDETDREVLNGMTDQKLKGLIDTAKASKDAQAIANSAIEGFEDEHGGLHAYNLKTKQWEHASGKKPPAETQPTTNTETLTEDQWMAQAPDSIRELVDNYRTADGQRRAEFCEIIVANEETSEAKKAKHERLNLDNQTTAALEEMANDLQKARAPVTVNKFAPPQPSYLGNGGGPTTNKKVQREPMERITLNFDD